MFSFRIFSIFSFLNLLQIIYQINGTCEKIIVSLSFSSNVWSLFISKLIQVANFIEFQIFCSLALRALCIHFTRSAQIRKKNTPAKIVFKENQNMLILRKNQKCIKIM
jgi:hypothetical protein